MGCVSSKLLRKQETGDDGYVPPKRRARKPKTPDGHPQCNYGSHFVALTSTSYGMLSMDSGTLGKKQEMPKAGTFSELYKIRSLRSPPKFLNAILGSPKCGKENRIAYDDMHKQPDISEIHSITDVETRNCASSHIQETIDVNEMMKGLEDDVSRCPSPTEFTPSSFAVQSKQCAPRKLKKTHKIEKIHGDDEDHNEKENSRSLMYSLDHCRTPFGNANAIEGDTMAGKRKDTGENITGAAPKVMLAGTVSSIMALKRMPSNGMSAGSTSFLTALNHITPSGKLQLLQEHEKKQPNGPNYRTGPGRPCRLYDPFDSYAEKCPPHGEARIVLYTTTLRGIRKTFEDCNKVRSILQSFNLRIDERDLSMHLRFLHELRELMGTVVSPPRLFIKGRYIGGEEEVSLLFERDKFDELVEGLPLDGGACGGCGGIRFVPCLECSGSCKLVGEGNVVRQCPHCNENGLIQCPICT